MTTIKLLALASKKPTIGKILYVCENPAGEPHLEYLDSEKSGSNKAYEKSLSQRRSHIVRILNRVTSEGEHLTIKGGTSEGRIILKSFIEKIARENGFRLKVEL